MMDQEQFLGDKKVSLSLLGTWESKLIERNWHRFPRWIEGYHLTLTSFVWSLGVVVFGYLAQTNIHWLWLSSIMIVLQWFTDSFDGTLGKKRNTGIPRWGFYMDHFLDYIFLCSLFIGYSFILPDRFNTLFFILVILGAYMVNSYLAFSVTDEFKIEYLKIGPTEARIIFIVINTLIIFFQKTYLAQFLPAILIVSSIGLAYVVYETQKKIWKKDMELKK